jgi:hypothetical protein
MTSLQTIQDKLSFEMDKTAQRKLQFSGNPETGLTSEDVKRAIVHGLPKYVVQSFKLQVNAFLIQPTLDRKEVEKAWEDHASSKVMIWMDTHQEITSLVSVQQDGRRLQKRLEVYKIIIPLLIAVCLSGSLYLFMSICCCDVRPRGRRVLSLAPAAGVAPVLPVTVRPQGAGTPPIPIQGGRGVPSPDFVPDLVVTITAAARHP